MASRDSMNNLHTVIAVAPQAVTNSNTAVVGPIIDTAGFEKVTFSIAAGALTDVDSGLVPSLEHGDDPALADTAAPAASDLVGTLALATFAVTDANKTKKVGYVGSKRYLRLTLTPTSNEAGTANFAATAILSQTRNAPTANPPQ